MSTPLPSYQPRLMAQGKNILISSLGYAPGVVTGTVDAIKFFSENDVDIHKVLTISTSDQQILDLAEENNLHLHEYQDTYISLLELNFRLAEDNYEPENEDSVNTLFYALKSWLNACKDQQNTIFEDEKTDREIEIHKAIFEKG